jgi:hypothetical protein
MTRIVRLHVAVLALASQFIFRVPLDPNLMYAGSFTWTGAFKVPTGNQGDSQFGYGGLALGYNSAGNGGAGSLYFSCHADENLPWNSMGEITIPTALTSEPLSTLNRATTLQVCRDETDGKADDASGGVNMQIGGIAVIGSGASARVISNRNLKFSGPTYEYSFFASPLDLDISNSDAVGPVEINSSTELSSLVVSAMQQQAVAGYISEVPTEWQDDLGGTHIAGWMFGSVIAAGGWCPTVMAFDAADVEGAGTNGKVTGVALMACGGNSGTPLRRGPGSYLLDYNGSTELYNQGTWLAGCFIPANGKRSLLCLIRFTLSTYAGGGQVCYKGEQGDAFGGLPGQSCSMTDCCGCGVVSGDPYAFGIAAYDLNDLIAVKNGSKSLWEPRPYSIWFLSRSDDSPMAYLPASQHQLGLAHDPVNKRVWTTWGASIATCNTPPESNHYPLVLQWAY